MKRFFPVGVITMLSLAKHGAAFFSSKAMRVSSAALKFSKMKEIAPTYFPKSINQKRYVQYLDDKDNKIIAGVGPAGTGKTLFACLQGIKELQRGDVNKIILTRPVVPVEEDLGFLPGNLNKKMDPWVRPVFDLFLEYFTQKDIDAMLNANVLEISPLAYMRGRTFKRSFIIADEMQNSSPNQMMMVTTRIGVGSRMVLTGDLKQCDKGHINGLGDFIHRLHSYKEWYYSGEMHKEPLGIRVVEFEKEDVERSPIVKHVLGIYGSE